MSLKKHHPPRVVADKEGINNGNESRSIKQQFESNELGGFGRQLKEDEPWAPENPLHAGFHSMCENKLDANGTCSINGGIFRLKESQIFKNDKVVSLILKNTVI